MRACLDRLSDHDGTGDPGRVHEEGRFARVAIETAREQVAALANVPPSRVVFTSGATEAANTAIADAAGRAPGALIASAAVEHSCVRDAADRSSAHAELAVAADGTVEIASVEELLAGGRPVALVNCQWANQEVGTVQPVSEVAALCRAATVPCHVDAAAAFGHVATDLGTLGADYVSVSAHKVGGPAGVGALILGAGVRLRPLIVGGSQERGRRAGIENLLGIVGFGAAADDLASTLDAETRTLSALTTELASAATSVPGVRSIGNPDRRVPHITCFVVDGVLGEAVLLSLDRAGIAVHSGSACSSELLEPSPVLAAMGEDPDRSLRLSVGWSSSRADVTAFAAAFAPAVDQLRALGS
jgi:cysteine desulfurase